MARAKSNGSTAALSGLSLPAQRRALKLSARERQREVVPRLRKAVVLAKRNRSKRLAKVRADCKRKFALVQRNAVSARKALIKRIALAGVKAKEACAACKVQANSDGLDRIDAAFAAVETEREAIADLRSRAGRLISQRGRAGGRRSAELRAESDDEVARDLDDDETMVALWKRVKSKITASPRRTRTEAFFEYVQDHPEELDEQRSRMEVQWEREADAAFARMKEAKIGPMGEIDELETFGSELDAAHLLVDNPPASYGSVPF